MYHLSREDTVCTKYIKPVIALANQELYDGKYEL